MPELDHDDFLDGCDTVTASTDVLDDADADGFVLFADIDPADTHPPGRALLRDGPPAGAGIGITHVS